jgi:hypothetical protein
VDKTGDYQSKRLHSNGRLLALPTNIRLWWELKVVENTSAYYDTATIRAKERFIAQEQIITEKTQAHGLGRKY